jgi:hypothetical protein
MTRECHVRFWEHLGGKFPGVTRQPGHGQPGFPAIETDGLAQQQPGHHPGEEHQMALIADGAVLTEKAGELTVEPGSGIHERLD